MKLVKILGITLISYVGLVVAFACFVGFMGHRDASREGEPDAEWVVLTTTDADGTAKDAVVAGFESGGQLYVAANHWPRGWYERAIEHPDVEIVHGGETTARRAVAVSGEERVRIAEEYQLPWVLRFLTGFPPRSFLRLDPR